MSQEETSRTVLSDEQQQPSTTRSYYYGTFQGVANHQPHVNFGYQTVPGNVINLGPDVIVDRRPLLCCGYGIGWFLFFIGFFCGAIPWYVGAFILLCARVDYREKSGLVACTIAAFLALIVFGLGVRQVEYDW